MSSEVINSSAASGNETSLLVSKLQQRIELVSNTVRGRRNLHNLWGLKPVRVQELATWGIGELISPHCNVAGIRLASDDATFEIVDDLIALAMKSYSTQIVSFEPQSLVNGDHRRILGDYRRILGVTRYKSFRLPIGFQRIATEECIDPKTQVNLPIFGHHARFLRWEVYVVTDDRRR